MDDYVLKTKTWRLNDRVQLHQILITVKPEIRDLVVHSKKLWYFLKIFMMDVAMLTGHTI